MSFENLHRGILEEFAAASRAYRRAPRPEGVSANLDVESLRVAYRSRHEHIGLCRSCRRNAKPGRKYCVAHLAKAGERARRSLKNLVGSST